MKMMPALLRPLLMAALFLALSCDDAKKEAPTDGAAPGAGGAGGGAPRDGAMASGGTGAGTGGAASGGRGGGGGSPPAAGGAGGVDAAAGAPGTDAGRDASLPPPDGRGPIIGSEIFVRGGPCMPGCMALAGQYAEALAAAKSCTPGAVGACASRARATLACGGCPAWVEDTAALAPLADRFRRECSGCFLGGPGGEDRCHLTGCPDLVTPVCMALPSGKGTCVNMERQCAAGTRTGGACGAGDLYCQLTPQSGCLCLSGRWSCS